MQFPGLSRRGETRQSQPRAPHPVRKASAVPKRSEPTRATTPRPPSPTAPVSRATLAASAPLPRPHSLPPLLQRTSQASPLLPPVLSDDTAPTAILEAQETASRKLIGFAENLARNRLLATTKRPANCAAGTPSPAEQGVPASCDARQTSVGEGVFSVWQRTMAQAQGLSASGHLSQSYLLLSAAIPEFVPFPILWAQLRIARAGCSYALINFRECIDDCEAVLAALSRESDSDQNTSELSFASLPPSAERQLWTQLTRACIMREEYSRAHGHYREWLARGVLTEAEASCVQQEAAALPAVQAFRQAILDGEWELALQQLRGPSCEPIAVLASATPLRALEAVVLIELGFVDEARASLLAYLPTVLSTDFLDGPCGAPIAGHPARATLADCPAEERPLYRQLVAHYLQCSVMAAKASVFTGPAYLNVAAVLVRRCLVLEPAFAPALRLGAYLVSVEDQLAVINEGLARSDWPGVLRHATEALRLDSKNTRLGSILHVYRAEALTEMDKPLSAMEACTVSLYLNPCNPRPYFLRALLHQLVRQPDESAADRQRAAELAPALYTRQRFDDEWAAMQARQQAAQTLGARDRHGGSSTCTSSPPTARSRPFPRHTADAPSTRPRPAPRPSPGASSSSTRGNASSASDTQTLYDLLQISRTASTDDVRRAYKALTLRYHPDKVVNESDEVQMYSLHMFKRINEAHHVLSDATKRAAYDQSLQRPL